MAINWPNSPTDGQQFTDQGITWQWDATASVWTIQSAGEGGSLPIEGGTITGDLTVAGTITSVAAFIAQGTAEFQQGLRTLGDLFVEDSSVVIKAALTGDGVIFTDENDVVRGKMVTGTDRIEFLHGAANTLLAYYDQQQWVSALDHRVMGNLTVDGDILGDFNLSPVTIAETEVNNPTSGFQIVGDVLFQWFLVPTATPNGTVTFPYPFDTGVIPAVVASPAGTGTETRSAQTANANATTFDIHRYKVTTADVFDTLVYAVGRAPAAEQLPKEVGAAGGGSGSSVTMVAENLALGWQVVGGKLIQWGTATPVGGVVTITFPKSFKNAEYSPVAEPISGANSTVLTAVNPRLPTEMDVYVTNSVNGDPLDWGFEWIAVGEALDEDKLPLSIDPIDPSNLDQVEIVEADVSVNTQIWQVWGDLLICAGSATGDAANEQSINFTKQFAAAPHVITNPRIISSGVRTSHVTTVDETQFGFRVFNQNGDQIAQTIRWMAIGQALAADKQPKTVDAVIGASQLQEFHDPTTAMSWRIIGNTLEVWSRAVLDANGDYSAVFPKTFKTLPAITSTPEGGGTVFDLSLQVNSTGLTTSGISFKGGYNATFRALSFSWHAIGEWDGNP